MNSKVLFCGGGNMAEGILRSVLKKEVLKKEQVTVNDLNPERCAFLENTYGVKSAADGMEAMADADVVVIAVLPQIVSAVAENIRKYVRKDALIISIAAGVTIATLEKHLGEDRRIVRVMPNTIGQAANGHSAVKLNGNVDEEQKEFVEAFLGALGQIMYLDEAKFAEFTAYSCSGPMWLYLMADALIDAGVYAGFSRTEANEIVKKNLLGVAMILNDTGVTPKSRVDEMCSPGGVTIEGFKSLKENGFDYAVMESVNAAVQKSRKIQQENNRNEG
ncbi:MAG: pyrroline-5-carboxylate reductase [Emergencia sp.]